MGTNKFFIRSVLPTLVAFAVSGCAANFKIGKSKSLTGSPAPAPAEQKKEPVAVTIALPADPGPVPSSSVSKPVEGLAPSDIQISTASEVKKPAPVEDTGIVEVNSVPSRAPTEELAKPNAQGPVASSIETINTAGPKPKNSKDAQQPCVDSIQPAATPEPNLEIAPLGTSICEVKVDGVVQKTVFATNRQQCYDMIAFGALNCETYAHFIPNDGKQHFLDQVFNLSDRVTSEYCETKASAILCSDAKDSVSTSSSALANTAEEIAKPSEAGIPAPKQSTTSEAAPSATTAEEPLKVVKRSIEENTVLSKATDELVITLNKNIELNTFSINAQCFDDETGNWIYNIDQLAWKPLWKKMKASANENVITFNLFKMQYLPKSNNCTIDWSIVTNKGALSEKIHFKNQQAFEIQGSGVSSNHIPYFFMGGNDSFNIHVSEIAVSADKTKFSLSCEGKNIPLSGGWAYDRTMQFYLETPHYLPVGICNLTAAEGGFVSASGAKSPATVISIPVVQQPFYIEMGSEGHGGGGNGQYLTGVNRVDDTVPPSEVYMLFLAKIPVNLQPADLTVDCADGVSRSIERITDSGPVQILTFNSVLPHGKLCKVRMTAGKYLTDILGDKNDTFEVNLTVDGYASGTTLNRNFSFPYNPDYSTTLVYQANRYIQGQLDPANYAITCTSGVAPKVSTIIPEFSFKGSVAITLDKPLDLGQSCTAVVKNQKAWDGSDIDNMSVDFSRTGR